MAGGAGPGLRLGEVRREPVEVRAVRVLVALLAEREGAPEGPRRALDGDLVTGEISVGYFERDYEDPTVETFDGLAVAAALEWYITRLTTITFTGRQDADDQIGASAEPFVTTEFGARVDHELLRNLILSLAGLAGKRDYESIDRNDEYTQFELGADWLLNPHAVVRLRYQYDDVESDGALARPEFDVNAVTLGLSLRL